MAISKQMNNDNLEIDIFKIFIKYSKLWKFIITSTIIFTIIGSYAYLTFKASPYFVSTAKVQIGSYLSNSPNKNGLPFNLVPLDDIEALKDELRAKFTPGTSSDDGIITSISSSFNGTLIEIEGKSNSRDDLVNKLSEVTEYIFLKHEDTIQYIKRNASNLLQTIKQEHKFDALQMNSRISFIEDIQIPELDEKIKTFTSEAIKEEAYFKKTNILKHQEASDILKFEILKLKNKKEYLDKVIIPYLIEKANEAMIKINKKIENEIYAINEIQLPAHFKKVEALNQIILAETTNLELISSDTQLLKDRALKSPSMETVIHQYKTELIENESEILFLTEQLKFLNTSIQNDGAVDIVLNSSRRLNEPDFKLAPTVVIDLQRDLLSLKSDKDGYENDSKLMSIEILQLEKKLATSLTKVFPELSPDQISIKNDNYQDGESQNIFLNNDTQLAQLKQEKSELENDLNQLIIYRDLAESEFAVEVGLANESLNEKLFKKSSISGKFNTILKPSLKDKFFYTGFIFVIGLLLSILLASLRFREKLITP